VKSIRKVLRRGDVVCMYPEARYSPCGVDSYIPDSVGMLIKMNKTPVVAILHRGNHLHSPFWNFRKKRKVPFHTTVKKILSVEQIEKLSADEITKIVREALTYDDYRYQKENGIRITEPYRAEGLHKVLYQCPHCMTESKMDSKGTEIFCTECGKRWTLMEDGTLSANDGNTEFSHVPDWFSWEREQVTAQVENGTYRFEDEVDVYSMPRCWRFEHLGGAKLTHDPENGFVLDGHYRGADYHIHRAPMQSNSLHIEYDYCYIKPFDCVEISTENDSFTCYPKKQNVVTKMAFATEAIYQKQMREKRTATREK
jgi:DNA-directed RNA polymerase subunit RPC12/RpoP